MAETLAVPMRQKRRGMLRVGPFIAGVEPMQPVH